MFIAGSLLALVISEGVVRLLAPQQLIVLNERIWMPDSALAWKHVSSAEEQVNLGEQTVWFVSDENGHRINRRKASGGCARSILFLGDSFLEALQVENESTFVEIIRRSFLQNHGEKLCVVNSGVGGWGPNQYFICARAELQRQSFALGVVCLYAGNDIVSRFDTVLAPRAPVERHLFELPRSFSFSEWKQSVFYPVNDFLETRSHLFLFMKNRGQTMLSKVGLTAEYFPPIFSKSYVRAQAWATTAEICFHIKKLFDERDVPVLFVLLPTPYQVHEQVFRDYVRGFDIDEELVDLEQPNKLLTEELKKRGIVLLDPLRFFRRKAEEGQSLYGKVDNHFNENGHRALAEFLVPYVEEVLGQP